MQDYKKLKVWQKAHRLAIDTLAVSAFLKSPDAWALRDQMLRAAISIPSNIAEGCRRGTSPDLRRFLWHSLGSCHELEYDLQLAREVQFLPSTNHNVLATQVAEVRRMLTGLVERIQK